MPLLTVSEFALEIRRPVQVVLQHLHAAGRPKQATDRVTDEDREALLVHLRQTFGAQSSEPLSDKPEPFAELEAAVAELELQHQILGHYAVIRRNGAVVPFAPTGSAIAMMKAFIAVHGAARELRDRIARFANRSQFAHSYGLDVDVEPADGSAWALLSPFKSGLANELVWATFRKRTPRSQEGLRKRTSRSGIAQMASAARRVMRFEHFLPASAATISLA